MRAYFMHLPVELEEAARIDGCGRLGVFLRIVVPISRGPIAGYGDHQHQLDLE